MAIIRRATLSPSKLELIEKYLPVQSWFNMDGSAPPELLGAYRFDDPDGEVGLETHLVSHGGKVYQVPLSYRGSKLPGAEDSLLGTMEHSVLGTRWVYDACADPVYVVALATAILTGQQEAEQFVDVDGVLEPRKSSVNVKGSGTPGGEVPVLSPAAPITEDGVTSIEAGELTLLVNRVLDLGTQGSEDSASLRGTWAGQEAPVLLGSLPQA
ncbi:CG0192-related protein [Arthrobacter sp. 2MCAF14]|uniref:CG0192-related protein n=1 Tax=Arthrobacter sp. 2MCAF14 TaxID=3232982 RepID=UPI003F92B8EA